MCLSVGSSIYNAPSIYESGQGGGVVPGTVLLDTSFTTINDNCDIPNIGPNSENLTVFNYSFLNPGISIDCNDIPADYGNAKTLYNLNKVDENFNCDIDLSISRLSSFYSYYLKIGPFELSLPDAGDSATFARGKVCAVLGALNSLSDIVTNVTIGNKDSGVIGVMDDYTQDKPYKFKFSVNESSLSIINVLDGKYMIIPRSAYNGNFALNIGFGPSSLAKNIDQKMSLYRIVVTQ